MTRPAVVLEIVETVVEQPASPRPLGAPHLEREEDVTIVTTETVARRRDWLDRLPRVTLLGAAEFLLLALLALQCARLVWTLFTPLGPVGAWTLPVPAPPAPRASAPLDFDPFFRSAPQAAGPVVVTSLDLTLHGVLEDRATGRGSAIIGTPDGRQNSFVVGEEIVEGVTLAGVASDSVTISRGGATEQIFLGAAEAGDGAEAAPPPPPPGRRP